MKVRGRRECTACGEQWSYYATERVACPSCGSLRSVGIDDRTLHTASNATLDLTPIRNALDGEPLRQVADRAAERCHEFTKAYGFVDAGELLSLSDEYLAALELQRVGRALGRRLSIEDDEEQYLYELFEADAGERPPPEAVPDSLRDLRGLAYATAISEYRSDLGRYLDEHPDPLARDVLERLRDHVRRVRALDGDIDPREIESLIKAARAVGRYLSEGEENALAEADRRIDALS